MTRKKKTPSTSTGPANETVLVEQLRVATAWGDKLREELEALREAKEAAERESAELQQASISTAAEVLKLREAFEAKERALLARQSALEEEYRGKMGVTQDYGRTLAQKTRDLDAREAALGTREKKMNSTVLALASSQARIIELETDNSRLLTEQIAHSTPVMCATENLADADGSSDVRLRRQARLAEALCVTEALLAAEIAAAEEREALRVELDKHVGHAEARVAATTEETEALRIELDKHAGHADATAAAAAEQTEELRIARDKDAGHIEASAATAAADRAAAARDRDEVSLLVSKHAKQSTSVAVAAPTMPVPTSTTSSLDADPIINPTGGSTELAVSASAAIAVPVAQGKVHPQQLEALQKELAAKNELLAAQDRQLTAQRQQLGEAIEATRNMTRLMLMQASLQTPQVAIPSAASSASLGRDGFFSSRRASACSLPSPSGIQAVTPGMPLV